MSSPVTQSPSADRKEQPTFRAGMRPWAPPPVSSALGAIEPEQDASFVFHDPAGRRWSRIKRLALVGAAALLVVGGGVVVAITRMAPGRAQALTAVPSQLVPDWQVRDPGSAPPAAAAPPTSLAGPAGQSPAPAPTGQVSPTPSQKPSPTPSKRPSPRHTPIPPINSTSLV